MTKEKIHVFEGHDIVVHYDLRRCIHAKKCVNGLPTVFDTNRRPWIHADEAPADHVAKVVMQCPTGALFYERKDGGYLEPPPDTNIILITKNGPLYVQGNVRIMTPTAVKQEFRLALCRCGASANKPYCDNSHVEVGFKASDNAADNQLEQQDSLASGILAVTPERSGPFLLQGSFEIQNSEGRLVFRGDSTELCRCGGSQNKPFCDGNHMKIGFSSE